MEWERNLAGITIGGGSPCEAGASAEPRGLDGCWTDTSLLHDPLGGSLGAGCQLPCDELDLTTTPAYWGIHERGLTIGGAHGCEAEAWTNPNELLGRQIQL